MFPDFYPKGRKEYQYWSLLFSKRLVNIRFGRNWIIIIFLIPINISNLNLHLLDILVKLAEALHNKTKLNQELTI
jgi:hypothetical protein